jgi:hypothetical protein
MWTPEKMMVNRLLTRAHRIGLEDAADDDTISENIVASPSACLA